MLAEIFMLRLEALLRKVPAGSEPFRRFVPVVLPARSKSAQG
jgi:hypothetical protein